MRPLLAVTLALAISQTGMQELLQTAFYPALLLVFIVASLGIPIPEDIPLITAGVILRTNPEIASPAGAFLVSMIGIMSGDVILYNLGRKWGRDVFAHRSVAWLITPRRLDIMTERFHRWGVWACFFGRFMVGVRAIMCLTAGVTRFPFWKFFLADFCGALLSVPFFIGLGYFFAGMLDSLKAYLAEAQLIVGVVIGIVIAAVIWYEFRRLRKMREADAVAGPAVPVRSADSADVSPPEASPPIANAPKPPARAFEPAAKAVPHAK